MVVTGSAARPTVRTLPFAHCSELLGRHLDMFERSKNAKGYLKCHGMTEEGHTTQQFRKWRNANRKYKQERPLIIKPPFETKEGQPLAKYPPTIAFPGPRSQVMLVMHVS